MRPLNLYPRIDVPVSWDVVWIVALIVLTNIRLSWKKIAAKALKQNKVKKNAFLCDFSQKPRHNRRDKDWVVVYVMNRSKVRIMHEKTA